jgi:hypothetical protein
MLNKLTHVKYRRAIRHDKRLVMNGDNNTIGLEGDAYHADRARLGEKFDDAEKVFEFAKDLEPRKTPNPTYPLKKLLFIVNEKCGFTPPSGVLIAALIARGFHCTWGEENDPRFNISSSSKGLQ